ncbi:MAG: BolA/IbaG family iron-sulfur metabolism protein [Proteobacteria bacterium]|nr:BolA/IbaG family iron-sulfur metabolism protein [Pseudomonadota bacterium]
MDSQIIKELIEAGLVDADVVVEGDDGTHFQARIVSELFTDKTMVQQHQMVYKTLGDKMGTDIHALSFQTYTPEEWEKQK